MAEMDGASFSNVQARLNEIVDEVKSEGISLDDALVLYEEAVKLGLAACDMSEQEAEALLAQQEADMAEQAALAQAEVAAQTEGSPEPQPGDQESARA